MIKISDCQCEICKDSCWHNPGWFGNWQEIEGAARIMGLSFQDFCREYLIQEWWAGEDEHISIPAPRRNFERRKGLDIFEFNLWEDEFAKNGKGFIRASWGHNLITGVACIFLTEDELCLIHGSKPRECREVFACRKKAGGRMKLLTYWRKNQKRIKEL